jgi:hypothetical protein
LLTLDSVWVSMCVLRRIWPCSCLNPKSKP